MAEENRDWGYGRIQGALSNLGHELARSTIAEILERHGIEPAPERSRKTSPERTALVRAASLYRLARAVPLGNRRW
jgi:hypothetical protein